MVVVDPGSTSRRNRRGSNRLALINLRSFERSLAILSLIVGSYVTTCIRSPSAMWKNRSTLVPVPGGCSMMGTIFSVSRRFRIRSLFRYCSCKIGTPKNVLSCVSCHGPNRPGIPLLYHNVFRFASKNTPVGWSRTPPSRISNGPIFVARIDLSVEYSESILLTPLLPVEKISVPRRHCGI